MDSEGDRAADQRLDHSPLAATLVALVDQHEHPAVRNHSIRVVVHARAATSVLSYREGSDYYDDELLAACLLHDLGTADVADGFQRFEVDGADAASELLEGMNWSDQARQRVWTAIALHTTPGIAERIDPLTHLVRAGVVSDFTGPSHIGDQRIDLEAAYPRLDIERVLAGIVVGQALRRPEKAPRSSWPSALLEAHSRNQDIDDLNPAF